MIGDNERTLAQLVTAAEVATRLGVTRAYVYEHAEELGAIRLGNGTRPRLRFDLQIVQQMLRIEGAGEPSAEEISNPRSQRRVRRSATRNGNPKLLPIKGRTLG